ncbi:MAG: 30S ribosomal protein S21 [Acidobacteria bacterium]|nr:30S ribosomal protein S21 [Acidobacteriota bacterium]MCG2817247.1 30S ribosomal protein S21 [Candidatus Aminicenantes bacterium]MBU1473900.1 30S ribosomal protein S21 [Acidobacteriota bacterium]MBU4203716.1 30S ribosomal protein S21 [Acidobacteriota bacterium]MBU4254780.1 30S ribosomal protein S21 [Acidobacteriota bacterium]
MAHIVLYSNESIEQALRRFKRQVMKEAIMKDIKKSSVYLTPSQKRRLKDAQALKRIRRRLRRSGDTGV